MKKILVIFGIVVIISLGVYVVTSNNTEAPVVEQEQDQAVESATVEDIAPGTYVVDKESSELTWEAEKIVGADHVGTIPVSSQENIIVSAEGDVQGTLVFTVAEITSDTEQLTTHLKSDDFFDVATYPEATLELLSASDGVVTGNLTIRDVTREVSIPVVVTEAESGVMVRGNTTIDRTEYDITFMSGTFFGDLGDNAIRDNVDIAFSLMLRSDSE